MASQWELGIKGHIQLCCLYSTPVGSCPPEGGGGILAKASWLPLFVAWPTVCGIRLRRPQQNGPPSVAGDRSPCSAVTLFTTDPMSNWEVLSEFPFVRKPQDLSEARTARGELAWLCSGRASPQGPTSLGSASAGNTDPRQSALSSSFRSYGIHPSTRMEREKTGQTRSGISVVHHVFYRLLFDLYVVYNLGTRYCG